MKMQTAHAKYQQNRLAFQGRAPAIPDGADVMLVFSVKMAEPVRKESDAVALLRGRAKGEKMTAKLLKARREDRMKEQSYGANVRL